MNKIIFLASTVAISQAACANEDVTIMDTVENIIIPNTGDFSVEKAHWGLSNDANTNCVLDKCELLYPNFSKFNPTEQMGWTNVEGKGNILYKSSKAEDWTETVKTECSNTENNFTWVGKEYQVSFAKPDCSGALKSNSIPEQFHEYDGQNNAGTTGLTPVESTDNNNCPIDKCVIKKKDGTLYSGNNIIVSKTTTPAFKLFFKTNTDTGYVEEAQLVCSTADPVHEMTSPVFKVTQYTKCQTALSKKTEDTYSYKAAYEETSEITKIGIESSDTSFCPLDTCKILKEDGEEYEGNQVIMESVDSDPTNGFKIKYQTDVNRGYTQKFKVQCSTKDNAQTVQSDVFTVQAYDKCRNVLTRTNNPAPFEFAWSGTESKYQLDHIGIVNEDPEDCPATCELLNFDNEAYPSTDAHLSTDAAPNTFNIRSTYEIHGFTEKFKVECKTTADDPVNVQTVTSNAITITQSSKCISTLSAASEPKKSIDLAYNFDGASVQGAWANYFVNADKENCPITSCSLVTSDDGSAYNNENVKIGSEAPFDITYNTNVLEGYSAEFDVKCGNGLQDLTSSYSMSQKGRCDSRLSELTEGKKLVNILKYKDQSDLMKVTSAVDGFFKNDNDDGNCPVTKCELKKKGCNEDFTDDETKITNTAGDFQIESQIDLPFGYTSVMCVVCTNGDTNYPRQTIKQDNVKVELPSKCLESLSVKDNSSDVPRTTVGWGSTNQKVENGFSNFFVNNDDVNCGVKSCSLKAKGCASAYDGQNIAIGSASPWTISIGSDVAAGYSTDICVECKGDYQTITHEYQVVQTGRCFNQIEASSAEKMVKSKPYESTDSFTKYQVTEFFTNNVDDQCQLDSCDLYDETCTSKNVDDDNNQLEVDQLNGNQFIKASTNSIQGYDRTLCIKCNSGLITGSQDVDQSVEQKVNFVQVTKCAVTLSKLADSTKTYLHPYTGLKNWEDIGETFSTYFGNTDESMCGVERCTLKEVGCQSDFVTPQGASNTIKMESVSPWLLQGIVSHPDGYKKPFCLECANKDQVIQQDEISFEQTPYQNTAFVFIVIAILVAITLACFACRYLADAKEAKVQEQKVKEQKKEDDALFVRDKHRRLSQSSARDELNRDVQMRRLSNASRTNSFIAQGQGPRGSIQSNQGFDSSRGLTAAAQSTARTDATNNA